MRASALRSSAPVGVEHALAERLHDRAQPVGPGRDHLARELVRVDHRHAARAQARRDRAFARRDAAGEAEEVHGVSSPYTLRAGPMRESDRQQRSDASLRACRGGGC